MYIELGGSHALKSDLVPNSLVASLQGIQQPLDSKIGQAQLHIVGVATASSGGSDRQVELIGDPSTGRTRRKVIFEPEGGSEGDEENSSSECESSGQEEDMRVMIGTKQRERRARRPQRTSLSSECESSSQEEDMRMMAGTKQRARRARRPQSTSVRKSSGLHVEQFFDLEAEEGEEESLTSQEYSTDLSCQKEMDSLVVEEAYEALPHTMVKPLSSNSSSTSAEAGPSCSSSGGECEPSLLPGHLRWKERLREKAQASYRQHISRAVLLQSRVYGHEPDLLQKETNKEELAGLFHVQTAVTTKGQENIFHQLDSSVFLPTLSEDWMSEENKVAIKELFVTGSWGQLDAGTLLHADMEEFLGDFEDLETGQVFESEEAERRKKKEELKKTFDAKYDEEDGVSSSHVSVILQVFGDGPSSLPQDCNKLVEVFFFMIFTKKFACFLFTIKNLYRGYRKEPAPL